MMKRIHIAIILVLLLLIGALIWYFCSGVNSSAFVPGLYETGALELYNQGKTKEISDMLILSWDELIERNILYFSNGRIYTEYMTDDGRLINTNDSVLCGDLIMPNDGTLTQLGYSKNNRTAFAGCTKLTGIYIPDSVSELCDNAFYGCEALTAITFPIDCQIQSLPSGCFRDCAALATIRIPDSVELIGENAFMDCTSLRQVTFGEYCNISKINRNAFSGCTALTQFTLPASLSLVSAPQFAGCTSLERVEFMTALYINDGFFSTDSIKTVVFNCDPPIFTANIFENMTVTVYYPAENPEWLPEMCRNYGGDATWLPLNS